MQQTAAYERFLSLKYFASLDGLRCISILLVIWHHALSGQPGYLARGYLGVALFFVISGFLITTLLLREQQQTGTIALGGFYMRRTLRIFPLYFAVLGLYTAMVLGMRPHGDEDVEALQTFFQNLPYFLTYTSNWFVSLGSGRVIFYFAWSLATEEQFYLFWPCIVRGARRWYLPLLLMAALIAVDQVAEHLVVIGVWSRAALLVRFLTSIATPICLGCLLAYTLQRRRGFALAQRWLMPAWSAPLALLTVGLAIGNPDIPDAVVALAMTWLVGACCIRPDHLLVPLLSNRAARHVGTISYGMYLLHMLALNAAKRLVPDHADRPVLTFLAAAALAIVAASVSYRFLEQPFLRLKERFRAASKARRPTLPEGVNPAASATPRALGQSPLPS